MYARLSTLQFEPEKLNDVLKIVEESVLPAAKEQAGNRGFTVMSDPETGKVVVISMWESEDDMERGESSGYYRDQISKISDSLTGPPAREAFEVNINA